MRTIVLFLPFALSACTVLPVLRPAPEPSGVAVQVPDSTTIRPLARPDRAAAPIGRRGARDAASLDQTTPVERQAALAPAPARVTALGQTLAALGSSTEQGFWLRTGLVTSTRPGRVEVPGGKSVAVELRPSGQAPGAGSQLSLAAFRALELPLTQLVNVQVLSE